MNFLDDNLHSIHHLKSISFKEPSNTKSHILLGTVIYKLILTIVYDPGFRRYPAIQAIQVSKRVIVLK